MENEKFSRLEKQRRSNLVRRYLEPATDPNIVASFMEAPHIYWTIAAVTGKFLAFQQTVDGEQVDHPVIWSSRHLAEPFLPLGKHFLGKVRIVPIPSSTLDKPCVLDATLKTNKLTKSVDVHVDNIVIPSGKGEMTNANSERDTDQADETEPSDSTNE